MAYCSSSRLTLHSVVKKGEVWEATLGGGEACRVLVGNHMRNVHFEDRKGAGRITLRLIRGK
jgi:hypothetical protein